MKSKTYGIIERNLDKLKTLSDYERYMQTHTIRTETYSSGKTVTFVLRGAGVSNFFGALSLMGGTAANPASDVAVDTLTLPAIVDVKVVYSKEAVQQSIGYSADTTAAGFNTTTPASNGGSYWRPWDKIVTKYYGERWSRLSTGTATNADFTTDPSNSTMDVANGTSTGYRIFRNKIGGTQVQ